MSDAMVSFFAAIGVAGWTYSKVNRASGNNTTTSLTVAGIIGVIVFLAGITTLGAIFG